MAKKLSQDEIIKRFNKVHGDKYNYDLVKYEGMYSKVKIRHNICGKYFFQTPFNHQNGHGCSLCYRNSLKTTTEVIKDFRKIHGLEKYDYSEIDYQGDSKKVKIKHNLCNRYFFQKVNDHINGHGCPLCYGKFLKTNEEVIKDFQKIHGLEKYDYSKIDYQGDSKKVKIKHNSCGNYFFQKPNDHITGSGCPFCYGTFLKTKEEVIKDFHRVHRPGEYDYSEVIYIRNNKKVKIKHNVCGKYFFQTPMTHKTGSGCPHCNILNNTPKGEKRIKNFLEENNINFISQKKFKNCRNVLPLSFDFYLSDLNILIEFDGEQHYRPVKWFGGEEGFLKTQKRDKIKTDFAEKENIKLIRIQYSDFDKIEEILKKEIK